MKQVRTLVRIRHGSHLYGTNTPLSDQDFKSVHLPSGQGIILQRPEDHIDRKIKVSSTVKNTHEDTDDQSYSLQKWLGMLAKGDTVAMEILFCNDENIVEEAAEWPYIREIAKDLVNRECKGFVGYCKQQAAKYGIKGTRIATVRDLVTLLAGAVEQYGTAAKLATLDAELYIFCKTRAEHAAIVNIPSQAGTDVWHLAVLEKKMPYTGTIKAALDVFSRIYENYGDRARLAEKNEGVDWKAMSHAVRVARQAIELLTTGHITFPRPDAPELLAIKKGELPFSEVGPLLETLVGQVDLAANVSTLPEVTDADRLDKLVERFYVAQVL